MGKPGGGGEGCGLGEDGGVPKKAKPPQTVPKNPTPERPRNHEEENRKPSHGTRKIGGGPKCRGHPETCGRGPKSAISIPKSPPGEPQRPKSRCGDWGALPLPRLLPPTDPDPPFYCPLNSVRAIPSKRPNRSFGGGLLSSSEPPPTWLNVFAALPRTFWGFRGGSPPFFGVPERLPSDGEGGQGWDPSPELLLPVRTNRSGVSGRFWGILGGSGGSREGLGVPGRSHRDPGRKSPQRVTGSGAWRKWRRATAAPPSGAEDRSELKDAGGVAPPPTPQIRGPRAPPSPPRLTEGPRTPPWGSPWGLMAGPVSLGAGARGGPSAPCTPSVGSPRLSPPPRSGTGTGSGTGSRPCPPLPSGRVPPRPPRPPGRSE